MRLTLIDYAIEKLTELYIKQYCEDKEKNKTTYVSKKTAYQDLIKLLKSIQQQT